MLHHLHPARNSRTNAIQGQAGHRAEDQRERRNHLWLYVKTVAKKPEPHDHNASSDNRLRNAQDDSDSKQHSAPRAVAHSFRARDECGDRTVEAENSDLADDVSCRPGNRKYAECRWPEHPGHEKREYAAEIRRQHRDRIQEGAAFQLDSGFVYARWCVRRRRRNIEQSFGRAH